MFKKVLQSLSKSLANKAPDAPVAIPTPSSKADAAVDKVAKSAPVAAAPTPAEKQKTAEDLCEVAPKMTKEQVQARLKLLYRRYNRSASSLDAKVRAEADVMLDAIVQVREKHFGTI